ncbi:MAG: glucans biosynthesis glucosyltransferase MdoH [Burkholderiales bacterium]|nr:glucans biosynthesis glucosyltransferase MdoH [Burkholderiales bacterium]
MDLRHSELLTPPKAFGPSMPPLARGAMLARPWTGFWRGLAAALHSGTGAAALAPAPWQDAARRRRRALLALVTVATAGAVALLAQAQGGAGQSAAQWLQTALFGLLFAWVSAGCFTAVMGFFVLLRGDPHAMSKDAAGAAPLSSAARTAVIMPICNEDVATVFAGLRATWESLATTGALRLFDLYVLSDSSDPGIRAAELAAWADLRDAMGPDGAHVHYRWRQRRTRRKAGNVADFCRRWGRNHRYMVVLDADSVMSGDCLLTLVRLMEAHPQAGILQTAPRACGHASLHARAQQFAARVTGRLFTAGMQYWQLGEAHYWGHNAIIRVEPFMRHCALATLPGRGALAGEILSHDFVEAALMRRAGYQVWIVHDLAGSYEQQPPHLLAELQRDRRWCQGNLQNARLISEPGLHAVHRAMLATGAMAYVAAPLWLAYIVLGGWLWLAGDNVFIGADGRLALGGIGLWVGTITMLALPRLLGLVVVLLRREQRSYGGTLRLVAGSVVEAALSTLQAPLRMVAHTVFVVGALTGWKLEWRSPPRQAAAVGWDEAARRFGPAGLVTVAVAALLAALDPAALIWLLPVGLPLLLAIPLTVWTSRQDLGERLRERGWLCVPEESWTPSVLRRAWARAAQAHAQARSQPAWTDVIDDPRLCALVGAAMGKRRTSHGLRGRARRAQIEGLARAGAAPTPAQCMRFLSEPGSLQLLRAASLFPLAGRRAISS